MIGRERQQLSPTGVIRIYPATILSPESHVLKKRKRYVVHRCKFGRCLNTEGTAELSAQQAKAKSCVRIKTAVRRLCTLSKYKYSLYTSSQAPFSLERRPAAKKKPALVPLL